MDLSIKIILMPRDAHQPIGTNRQPNQDQDKPTVTPSLIRSLAQPRRTTTNEPNRSLHHGVHCQTDRSLPLSLSRAEYKVEEKQ